MGFSLAEAHQRARVVTTSRARVRGVLAVVTALLAVGLVEMYDRLSQTAPPTADSANAVLQGRAMADGNLLLHAWTLSGASFYVTDLPFYAVVAAVSGVSSAAAHEVGAIIYTLILIAAMLLARGSARGPEAVWRMAITFVLLVAPMPGAAVQLLLMGPFHAGTCVFLLLALLVLDSAGARLGGAVLFGLCLTLAVLSDALSVYVVVVPVAVVVGLRLLTRRATLQSEGALLAAALLSVPAALLAGGLIGLLGGFTTVPLAGSFVRMEDLPKNLSLTVQGVLLLFGANFFGQPFATGQTFTILFHLLGLGFVLFVGRQMIAAWRRGRQPDLVLQVMLVAMAFDVAAYLFSNQAIDLLTSRYLIPFFVFGSVIAGRAGARFLSRPPLRTAAIAVGIVYMGFLAASLRAPAASSESTDIGAWLDRNDLHYGLAAYWQASTVTVETGGRVRVRAIDLNAPVPSPYRWEAEASWYDPRLTDNRATFVLRDTSDPRSVDRRSVEAAFGPPREEHMVGHYQVLVWDRSRNLLDDLAR
jgi:hypothetical protein